MPTHQRLRVVHGQIAWMLATAVVLTAFNTFSLSAFFVLSVVGLFIVLVLTEPSHVSQAWRGRFRWIFRLGLVGFTYLVSRRVLEISPWEVF